MRRLFDALFTAIALVLFIPTFLILISWNAIPGDALYPLKSGLESITLLLLSGTPLVPKASMKITDVKFNDATALLNQKGSTAGYDLVVAQAKQTQNYIAVNGSVTDSTTFVQNIDTYQAKIEQAKKQVVAQAQSSGELPQNYVIPTPSSTIAPVATPQPLATQTPSAPSVSQQVVVTQSQTLVIQHEPPQQILQNLDNASSQLQTIKQEVQQHEQSHSQNQNPKSGQDQGIPNQPSDHSQGSSDHSQNSNQGQ